MHHQTHKTLATVWRLTEQPHFSSCCLSWVFSFLFILCLKYLFVLLTLHNFSFVFTTCFCFALQQCVLCAHRQNFYFFSQEELLKLKYNLQLELTIFLCEVDDLLLDHQPMVNKDAGINKCAHTGGTEALAHWWHKAIRTSLPELWLSNVCYLANRID